MLKSKSVWGIQLSGLFQPVLIISAIFALLYSSNALLEDFAVPNRIQDLTFSATIVN